MPVHVYLIDNDATNDADGHFFRRLSELEKVATTVSTHAPMGTKILVGPEAFFGTVPVEGYKRWDDINARLARISKAAKNVLIVPGSMLWRMRGYGGNVCPVWYNGSKIMDVYKCYPAGMLDALINIVTDDGDVKEIKWRNRSFWRKGRYDPADAQASRDKRKSQVFEWEGYNVGVSVCNDFRQNVVLDDATAKGVELDFHIVVSKVFYVQIPGDNGVNDPGNSNAVNHSGVRLNGYVIQCEGDAPAYPLPLPAPPPPPPPSPPSPRRKLFVCQKTGPAQFQEIVPNRHRVAPAGYTYTHKVLLWQGL